MVAKMQHVSLRVIHKWLRKFDPNEYQAVLAQASFLLEPPSL
jgi:hypothetical protein